jgi:endoglucanase Acf2
MDDLSDLVKVVVDLPHHWNTNGESMWARSLGNDLYELRNSPFSAYDLNYLDVVFAMSSEPGLKPQISRIERRSGHKTLRLIFTAATERLERDKILARINELGATYENANSTLYSLDIPPTENYQSLCDELWNLEESGSLEYETCEARVPGSFDAAPTDG